MLDQLDHRRDDETAVGVIVDNDKLEVDFEIAKRNDARKFNTMLFRFMVCPTMPMMHFYSLPRGGGGSGWFWKGSEASGTCSSVLGMTHLCD